MRDDDLNVAVIDNVPDLEESFLEISEDKFPSVLSEGLNALEKANEACTLARKREADARSKVKNALSKADELISLAKGSGKNTAQTHSFLGIDLGSFDSDEIDAIKKNLKELVDCGISAAEAQKDLTEVQSALLDSQSSLLYLSQAQQYYLEQTFKFSKVLCGFTALNQAKLEFLFQNLKEKLDGASKEKLGEMAYEQVLVVMDQWKNQQNILMRLSNNEKLIDNKADLEKTYLEFERINNKDLEQDKRIDQLAVKGDVLDNALKNKTLHDNEQDKRLSAHEKKDIEHDNRLNLMDKKDADQDKKIDEQIAKDIEHDRLLKASAEKDSEQDELLAAQVLKDQEHDRILEEREKKDQDQDLLIKKLVEGFEDLETTVYDIKKNKCGINLGYISLGIAIAGVFMGILHFFI